MSSAGVFIKALVDCCEIHGPNLYPATCNISWSHPISNYLAMTTPLELARKLPLQARQFFIVFRNKMNRLDNHRSLHPVPYPICNPSDAIWIREWNRLSRNAYLYRCENCAVKTKAFVNAWKRLKRLLMFKNRQVCVK